MRHIKLLCAGVIAAVLAAPCVPSAQPYERGTPERRDNLPGKWYVNGERDKLVEISSSRSGLQAKNENGDVRALDWEGGLRGNLRRDRIEWQNGTTWTRAPKN
jgi:hypothetical protein